MKARHYLIQSSGSQPTTGKSATKISILLLSALFTNCCQFYPQLPSATCYLQFQNSEKSWWNRGTVAIGVGRQVDDVTEFWILEEEREEHRWNGEKKILLCFRKDGCIMHACTGLASTDKLHEPSQGA